MSRCRPSSKDSIPESVPVTPEAKTRLRTLARDRWADNLADMARVLGLSQAAVWKMVAGDQPPSAALLTALARHTDVNLHWLLTGHGPCLFPQGGVPRHGGGVGWAGVPVATRLLRGRLAAAARSSLAWTGGPLQDQITTTQYWFEVTKSDPIVRHLSEQVAPGDWLLLETDPARFPPQDEIEERLVVVPGSVVGADEARLARVDEAGDRYMYVSMFDLGIDPQRLSDEIVVRELPDGKLQALRRKVVRERVEGRRGRPFERVREASEDEWNPSPLPVQYDDLLAVCVLSVRMR